MTSVRTPIRTPDWSPYSDRNPDLTRPDLTRPDPFCISPLRDDYSFPCLNYRPRARAIAKGAMEMKNDRPNIARKAHPLRLLRGETA